MVVSKWMTVVSTESSESRGLQICQQQPVNLKTD